MTDLAELQWVNEIRALMSQVEQVNPKASFQPEGLVRPRPTPYPLIPNVPVPALQTPTNESSALLKSWNLPNILYDDRSDLTAVSNVFETPDTSWALGYIPTLSYQIAALLLLGIRPAITDLVADLNQHQIYIPSFTAFLSTLPSSLQLQWKQDLRKNLPSILDSLGALPLPQTLLDARTLLLQSIQDTASV